MVKDNEAGAAKIAATQSIDSKWAPTHCFGLESRSVHTVVAQVGSTVQPPTS